MNFELTISGLCIVVLRSKEAKPQKPLSVDVIIPMACHHSARISYPPTAVQHTRRRDLRPKLLVDGGAGRIASLDLDDLALTLAFQTNPYNEFDVAWGEDNETPPTKDDEKWLNWLPKLEDLGFHAFKVGPSGKLPPGACARLTLPPGKLFTQQMLKKHDVDRYLRWDFPATGVRRALANHLVFSINGADKMSITDGAGIEILKSTLQGERPLQICVSNDLEQVPYNYVSASAALKHLRHLDAVVDGAFKEPTVVDDERTGHPICMSAVFVNRRADEG